ATVCIDLANGMLAVRTAPHRIESDRGAQDEVGVMCNAGPSGIEIGSGARLELAGGTRWACRRVETCRGAIQRHRLADGFFQDDQRVSSGRAAGVVHVAGALFGV